MRRDFGQTKDPCAHAPGYGTEYRPGRRPGPTVRQLLLAFLLAASAGAADQPAPAETAVALPPFIVEELAKGPPWRYAEAPGYEVLSRCNDATTRRVYEMHVQLHETLAEILPPSLRLKLTVPRSLIIYDEELQPAASQEVIRQVLNTAAEPPPNDRFSLGPGRSFRSPEPSVRYNFLPNLRLWDRDAMGIFMIVRRDDFEADRLSLTPDYVAFVVRRRIPSLPAWFVSGIMDLYRQTTFARGELTVEAMEWINAARTDALKSDPKKAYPVQPLGPFLSAQMPPAVPGQDFEPLKLWQSQAALFVRWGLDADKRAYREALWKFAERSAVEGPRESLFQECFGFGFEAAREKLTAYLPAAVRRTLYFRPEKRAKVPALPLTNATDGQIARLKGDWERLEVPYVKAISADLAPKYLEQARKTLRRAYDRDDRDPRLLAVMGLCEVDAGNDAGARDLLESARRIGPIRPRACYELGRLRLAGWRAKRTDPGVRMDVTQTATVLQPLFEARELQPPMPEVYELIAEAWAESQAVPTRRHLAVLDEGIRLFPIRLELVQRTADLYRQHGFPDEAAALTEVAGRLLVDEAQRARLERVRTRVEK